MAKCAPSRRLFGQPETAGLRTRSALHPHSGIKNQIGFRPGAFARRDACEDGFPLAHVDA